MHKNNTTEHCRLLCLYIRNKYARLLTVSLCIFTAAVILRLSGVSYERLVLACLTVLFIYGIFFASEYRRFKQSRKQLEKLAAELDRHYLAHELAEPPRDIESEPYYRLMCLADRDICNELSANNRKLAEYRELVEEWIHELKTPLTSLELISSRLGNDASCELERMKSILNTCLDYIRMDTLEKDYHVSRFKICDIIHSLIMEERTAVRAKQLRINVDIPEDCDVNSDSKWVRFIFKQLLNNAVRYTGNGGSIEFCVRSSSGMMWIGIKDTGCGISPQELPRIFDRGFTGQTGRRETASGIGLYLVKTCAVKMNLKINAESAPGQGSLFEVGFAADLSAL